MPGIVKVFAYLGVGLAVGFAIATWMGADDGAEAGADAWRLAARIDALERSLAREAQARAALADEIERLRAALAAAPAAGGAEDSPGARERGGTAVAEAEIDRAVFRPGAEPESPAERPAGGIRAIGRPSGEELERRRRERFAAAGFTPDRAEWIERRVDELRLEMLEAEHEAARRGEPPDPRGRRSVEERLREEIGDAEFERYLTAIGRPTTIAVREVLPGSAAEQSGLRSGDVVLSYGGRRVFDMQELNRLTLEGRPGEPVIVEVLRDGRPMQIYLPRGPVGIVGGRGRRFEM